MAEDVTPGQAPNDSGQVPRNTAPTAGTGSQSGQAPETEKFDAEYVKKLRSEAASYRTKLSELEQKVKASEDAKLSETERTAKRLAELEREQANYQRERQERTLKYETMLAANKLGIVDPDAAYRLLDLSQVEFETDGQPKDVEKHLQALIKARPYLAGGQSVGASSPTNAARVYTGGTFTKAQIADRAFWTANRDAIMKAIAEGRITD